MSIESPKISPEEESPIEEGVDFEGYWRQQFKGQDRWAVERTVQWLESLLQPDTADNTMEPEARRQGEIKLDLAKRELATRETKE